MQEYVAGFLFDDHGTQVALIEKNRPAWQAGKFNAIGGKIEHGEHRQSAMNREFKEEAGVETHWRHRFSLVRTEVYAVHFYSSFSTHHLDLVESQEDEPIVIHSVDPLPVNLIPNLRWIIPMILDNTILIPETIYDIAGN